MKAMEVKYEAMGIAERGELAIESVSEQEHDIDHYHASIRRASEEEENERGEDLKSLRNMEEMNEYVDKLVEASNKMGRRSTKIGLNKMVEMMIRYKGPFAWSNEIKEINVESKAFSRQEGTWTMRISVLMEVYGGSITVPRKEYGVASYTGTDFYMVYSMCVKGATTDALKRCLENVQMM